MRKVQSQLLIGIIGLVLSLALVLPVLAADAPRIEKEKLKEMLGKPELILIDVRAGADWKASTQKIKGAVREDPGQVDAWMKKYPKDQTLVFYCAWNNEGTSARVAQSFMEKGYTKVFALKGGWKEWSRSKYPVENK